MEKFPSNWKVKMKSLKDIDWLKTNPIWQNRILLNGRVIKSTISITLASNVIKKAYDINLTPEEQLLENNLKKGLKNVG
jgi:DNA sulfur modification protein DndB